MDEMCKLCAPSRVTFDRCKVAGTDCEILNCTHCGLYECSGHLWEMPDGQKWAIHQQLRIVLLCQSCKRIWEAIPQ